MNNSPLKKIVLAGLILGILSGCQTVPMPEGPSFSEKAFLPDAPIAGIHVLDKRTSENIGSIGLAFIKVKKDQSITMAKNYLSDFLYQQGLNTVFLPSIDFENKIAVRQIADQMNAKILFQLTVDEYSVTSVDLLLDKPSYEATLVLDAYDPEGKLIFSQPLNGEIESRALTAKATGEAVAQALDKAIKSVYVNDAFLSSVQKIKAPQQDRV